jgi:hypothetical protein
MSRIRADKVINRAGSGAPELTYGASIPAGYSITGAGGVNVTGIVTATGFVGSLTGTASTASFATTSFGLSGTPNITVGTISATSLNASGIGTVTIGIGNTALYVEGNARITGILSIGQGTVTIDGSTNRIIVGTGITINGNTGIISASQVFASGVNLATVASGSITPTSIVVGSGVTINSSGINVTGVVTATSFVGALTGTATSTTNIPNLTGAITSVGTATTLGSFSSSNLATALTDETGSGSAVFATSPTLVTPALGTPASGTLSNCTVDGTDAVGFRNIPQNSQSANYTLVLADNGKHIFHPVGDNNARTFTIPANSSVAYPIGTVLTFINMAAAPVTIAITTDTLTLSSSAGSTGSRTLAQYGSATCIKITSTSWIISGSVLS